MITLVLTTCKRLDMFKRTWASWMENWRDKGTISRVLLVDDSSSWVDRNVMVGLISRFMAPECIFHDRRSHAQSLIMMMEIVKGYYFLLEDDWLFLERKDYAQMLLAKGAGLVSLVQANPRDEEGFLMPPTTGGWPGWTLVPALHDRRTESMYVDQHSHERNYARWYKGTVAYLDKTYVKHQEGQSAYEINGSRR